MCEIEFKNIIYKEVKLTEGPNIDIKILKNISQNTCLKNSYHVAKKTSNITCIEGVILLKIEIKGVFFAHCWNKMDNNHFDITKNVIWSKNREKYEIMYFPVAEFTCLDYEVNIKMHDELIFLSHVDEMAKILNEELADIKKKII